MPLKEELSVWSCLFGAVCLDLSVCLFGGRQTLKMRQATKRVQNTYETTADLMPTGNS